MSNKASYDSYNLHGVPIFHKIPSVSASMLPDIDIITVPMAICSSLLIAIKSCGIATKYKSNVDKSIYTDYCSRYIDNYSFILATGQAILEEFKERFGYEHKFAEVIDYCEWNEPAIDELEDSSMRKYIGLAGTKDITTGKERKILHQYVDIENCINSWVFHYNKQPHLMAIFSGREKHSLFKYVKPTKEQTEQNQAIINYWTKIINTTSL